MTKPKKVAKRHRGQSASKAMLGVELRDYFAAHALPIAELLHDTEDLEEIANTAYKIANEMVKARANT